MHAGEEQQVSGKDKPLANTDGNQEKPFNSGGDQVRERAAEVMFMSPIPSTSFYLTMSQEILYPMEMRGKILTTKVSCKEWGGR